MKSLTLAAVAAVTLGVASLAPAQAETVDVATLKCADLKDMKADDIAFVITWIDGYMGGKADDTRFDSDRLSSNVDAAVKACESDDQQSIISVLKDAEKENASE